MDGLDVELLVDGLLELVLEDGLDVELLEDVLLELELEEGEDDVVLDAVDVDGVDAVVVDMVETVLIVVPTDTVQYELIVLPFSCDSTIT